MFISVIMTTHNAEKYIRDAVKSVLNQQDIEYELVIVDDGSTDKTPEILKGYEKGKNVRIFLGEHIGRGPALNEALKKAKGYWIANLDADDLMHPQKLFLQSQILSEKPEVGVLSTDSIFIHGDERPLWEPIKAGIGEFEDVTARLGVSNPVNHSSVLMRREALDQIGGYDQGRRSQLDYDLWIRLAQKGWVIGKLNMKLAAKRIHKGQHFESRRRISYLRASLHLQIKAIKCLGLPMHLYLLACMRFVYGLLPSKLRMRAKSILGKIHRCIL